MLSSTYQELESHREAVSRAALGQGMFPLDMRNDAAIADLDLIGASLAKVEEADAYVGLISYRYGQIETCPVRNPNNLSLTELEFRCAVERGIPICMFIMADDHQVPRKVVHQENPERAEKLAAFTALARKGRIYAEFKSVEDLSAKATQTLARLRQKLDGDALKEDRQRRAPTSEEIPAPPALYAKPPYLPGYPFEGRVKELSAISDWAGSADAMMLFEAIGGMGKSMVTWEWVNRQVKRKGASWAGLFWYSFYERGADMHDFCTSALAYVTQRPGCEFASKPTRDLADQLLPLLRARPWLLVLDGLERVLVEYHRADAAQLADEDVAYRIDASSRASNACIRAADDELLRYLCMASPSKVLISSRLMPRTLLNQAGVAIPGVRRFPLRGLDPRDAELMLRNAGVSGDGARMQDYLEQRFGCHPLIVGVVAGLVHKHMKAPGDFDQWIDDPREGAAVDLTHPDIRQRQNHILKLAFDSLDDMSRDLVARIAVISNAVDWEILEALNPARPAPPDKVNEPREFHPDLDLRLRILRDELAHAQPSKQPRIRRQILDRQRLLENAFQSARNAYDTYQKQLSAWTKSAELRSAVSRLTAALEDLETRGLLQCDRRSGMFDLHPVVRGYAVQMLSPEAREQTAQKVADYYASRSDAPIETASSWIELGDIVQVVRALSLAGKFEEVWSILYEELGVALQRLDRPHEFLELSRSLFPDGWLAPPLECDEAAAMASSVATRLHNAGYLKEAKVQQEFAIADAIKKVNLLRLSDGLRIHSMTLLDGNEIYDADQTAKLSVDVAKVSKSPMMKRWSELYYTRVLLHRGQAKPVSSKMKEMLKALQGPFVEPIFEAEVIRLQAVLDDFLGRLSVDKLATWIDRLQALRQRWAERGLWHLLGQLHQREGRDVPAIDAFEKSIEMARSARLTASDTAALRGVSLVRLGRRTEAADVAEALEEDPPYPAAALAALYLALEDKEQARHHALEGYRKAWADGPPFSDHSALRTCRTVLASVGEAEPQMASFDAKRMRPLDFEDDVRRLIADQALKPKSRRE